MDGQDFADVEAYGRERWLGELALALSEETYRPEPIFGADLPPEQYAYRPGRNAQQAVVEVEEVLFRSHPDVVDADLADYFGSIPHAEMLKSMALRVVDRRVLHLIKQWLECSVEETDGRGRKRLTTVAKDIRRCVLGDEPVDEVLDGGVCGAGGSELGKVFGGFERNHKFSPRELADTWSAGLIEKGGWGIYVRVDAEGADRAFRSFK